MSSAISAGYKRGIATIIDANVVTLLTAFILFVLATVRGQGLRLHPRRRHDRLAADRGRLHPGAARQHEPLAPAALARARSAPAAKGMRWHFDFMGASRWFFSISGVILLVGALALATKQLNFGIDFESGTRIKVGAGQADRRGRRARNPRRDRASAARRSSRSPTRCSATTSSRSSPTSSNPDEVKEAQQALGERVRDRRRTASKAPASARPSASRWPNSALKALIFSLLVICGYVALRFDPKFAVPVLIAIFHDILITAGVYSLTGKEVSSGTVAAFLTILGYSIYDTIIVFDRIRENVPRMPRAAFSQIVNRSMSEVLTRSLATSFSTLLGGRLAAGLRRRDPAGLRLRDAGRDRLRYLLVDLHRLAGADRLEGTRAGLRPPAPADRRGRGRRAGLRRRRRDRRRSPPTTRAEAEIARRGRAAGPRRRSRAEAGAVATAERTERGRRRRRAGRRRRRRPAATAAPTRRQRSAERNAARRARRRSDANTEGSADGTARLVHDGHRALALHRLPARPLLAGHRRRLPRLGHRRDRSSA